MPFAVRNAERRSRGERRRHCFRAIIPIAPDLALKNQLWIAAFPLSLLPGLPAHFPHRFD